MGLLTVRRAVVPVVLTKGDGFVPSDVANMQFWLSARYISGKSDGDTLTTAINDWSNAGNDITPVNSPTYESGAGDLLNGYPVIRLASASSHYLTVNDVASVFSGADRPLTLFMVMKMAATDANQDPWGFGRSTSNTPLFHCVTIASPSYNHGRRDDSNSNAAGSAGTVDTSWHILTWWFNGTTLRLYEDGVKQGNDISLDVGAITFDRFALGALLRASPINYCGMDLAEAVQYSAAVSVADMNEIGSYLGGVYGLTWADIPN
jgi:hypothetical protein